MTSITAKMRSSVSLAIDVATTSPTLVIGTDAAPTMSASRQWTVPYRVCRQAPTAITGTIAASDVATATCAEWPRKMSVGTKMIPPPTPNRAERVPASTPSATAISSWLTAPASPQ